ncbi:MAG: class A beta-lactamase-related serine hydrolase [Desulfobacteraceae bacterium]|nr:MAG: class A beta-lactamase-related serine hydrolase [Desulfobacteraceae bacterium]
MKIIDALVSKALRTITVPEDLTPLITYDPADEADPGLAGMTRQDVDAIWESVENLYRTGVYPGLSFCMRRYGQKILNRAIGHSHGNGPPGNATDGPDDRKILMTPDTPVCQYSASKAITAIMMHLLAERGEVSLSDSVVSYIPEFAVLGKYKITIDHILSHHGGVPAPPAGANPDILFDHDAFVKLICGIKPKSKDGGHMAYHAITGGTILAEIIRRVTGKDIREMLRESVQKPLGFRYFNYGVPEEDIPKVAKNYDTGFPLVFPVSAIAKRALSASWGEVVQISNEPRFMRAIIPAANLVATADEMSQFFQVLLDGGELNGKRIFQPETVSRAVAPAAKMWFDGTMVVPMRYSAGLMLGASPVGMWGPYTESAFGHIGFMNIFCWADPAREISVSLQTTGKTLAGPHLAAIVRFLFTIGRRCRMKNQEDDITLSLSAFEKMFHKMLRRMILGI